MYATAPSHGELNQHPARSARPSPRESAGNRPDSTWRQLALSDNQERREAGSNLSNSRPVIHNETAFSLDQPGTGGGSFLGATVDRGRWDKRKPTEPDDCAEVSCFNYCAYGVLQFIYHDMFQPTWIYNSLTLVDLKFTGCSHPQNSPLLLWVCSAKAKFKCDSSKLPPFEVSIFVRFLHPDRFVIRDDKRICEYRLKKDCDDGYRKIERVSCKVIDDLPYNCINWY